MEAGSKVEEQQERLASKQAEAEMRVPPTSPPGSHYHSHLKCAALLAGCCLLLYCTYLFRDYIHAVLLWTEHQPPAIVLLIFVALFTLVSLPLAWGYIVVNLACGYLFGFGHGLVVTVLTATAGVLAAHLIITYCLAGQVRRLLATSEYTRSLYTVITGPQAFKLVVLTRLTPVPFGLQNAVFSVSNLPCGRYLAASVLGLFPTQCINVYMGSTLRSMEEVLTNEDTVRTGWLLLLAQLIVSVILAVFVIRKARGELDRALEPSSKPELEEVVAE